MCPACSSYATIARVGTSTQSWRQYRFLSICGDGATGLQMKCTVDTAAKHLVAGAFLPRTGRQLRTHCRSNLWQNLLPVLFPLETSIILQYYHLALWFSISLRSCKLQQSGLSPAVCKRKGSFGIPRMYNSALQIIHPLIPPPFISSILSLGRTWSQEPSRDISSRIGSTQTTNPYIR